MQVAAGNALLNANLFRINNTRRICVAMHILMEGISIDKNEQE